MSTLLRPIPKSRPVYPDSDGQPMADNTLQYEWISIIKWNLEHIFADREDVFVAGDNLIYPVDGDPTIRQAPDVYVAFDRPKGYRGSYKVFEENDIFPQVIFEVWSPNNTREEMLRKRLWYEKYGAEEFYLIRPDEETPSQHHFITGWWRENGELRQTIETNGFVSPRLHIQFFIRRDHIEITGPDGRPFLNPAQIAAERDAERKRFEVAQQRADALAAKLRALGVDPDA